MPDLARTRDPDGFGEGPPPPADKVHTCDLFEILGIASFDLPQIAAFVVDIIIWTSLKIGLALLGLGVVAQALGASRIIVSLSRLTMHGNRTSWFGRGLFAALHQSESGP